MTEINPPPDEKRTPVTIAEVASTFWGSRKLIAYVTGGVAALALIISLLLPSYYRSTATLLPETEKSKLGSLGGLTDLASLAGINVAEGSMVKLYPTIIKSEAVLKNVIYTQYRSVRLKDSANLIQLFEIDEKTPELTYETALRSFREQLDVFMDNKTNVVTISIDTKEPQLSADIINRVTLELDRFIRTKRKTNASEQRKWIEARLSEVKSDLARSENTLKEFREKNRRVLDSPQLLLEQERLIREVQINSTLYTELKKQFEIVKIEEIKNIPIINIMDAGSAAAKKERPKRLMIVFMSTLFAFLGTVGYVFGMSRYGDDVRELLRELNFRIKKNRAP